MSAARWDWVERNDAPPLDYDTVRALIERVPLGGRVRVSYPNGARKSGVVGRWREYPTVGGCIVGGEYDGAVKVEVLAANGRYESAA